MNVDLADVLRIEPCLRVGLRIDAIEPPEAVEVIGVRAPQGRRQRLEHVVHRDAQRARLLAVQVDLDLRVVRIERSEQRAKLRAFPCFGEEFPRLCAKLVDGERAAAVLQQEIESGRGAEPGQGWNVEREYDRLGDGRELPLQPTHDALHMQGFALALLPRFEPHEDGAVVRLIRAGHRTVAANGLKGFDAVGLGEDFLDLLQHYAGPFERGAGRELGGDAEDSLVFVGDEPGRYDTREKAGADGHRGDDPDRQQRSAHEQAATPARNRPS